MQQLLLQGGPVNGLLAVFSVVALAIVFIKSFQLWRERGQVCCDQAMAALLAGHRAQAQLLLKSGQSARAQLLRHAQGLLESGRLTGQALQEELARAARQRLAPLTAGLRPLEVIAQLAPLLGLFGTVLGMIEAFRAMEAAGSQINPAILSGGIWQALLTTAAGLAVAIPVSLVHAWFERDLERRADCLHNDLVQLVHLPAPVKAAEAARCG